MNELFPILAGLAVGGALGVLRPAVRLPFAVAAAILLGAAATFLSGEFEISWSFLLIDIPLVALSSAAAILAGRALGRAALPGRRL
jgi:hypothetical protein